MKVRIPDYTVPLLIPFRDRIAYLRDLVSWAAKALLVREVIIFDMESSYPAALEWLDSVKGAKRKWIKVVRTSNVGARGLFGGGLVAMHVSPNQRFLLSDPDVIPNAGGEEAAQMIMRMHEVLDRYPRVAKVGCSLDIHDIPGHYPQKDKVVRWEQRFWQKTHAPGIYDSEVATTFCMIRRPDAVDRVAEGKSVRLAPPWSAKHRPWYENPDDLPPDVEHYYKHAPMRRWGATSPGVSWNPLQEPNR